MGRKRKRHCSEQHPTPQSRRRRKRLPNGLIGDVYELRSKYRPLAGVTSSGHILGTTRVDQGNQPVGNGASSCIDQSAGNTEAALPSPRAVGCHIVNLVVRRWRDFAKPIENHSKSSEISTAQGMVVEASRTCAGKLKGGAACGRLIFETTVILSGASQSALSNAGDILHCECWIDSSTAGILSVFIGTRTCSSAAAETRCGA